MRFGPQATFGKTCGHCSNRHSRRPGSIRRSGRCCPHDLVGGNGGLQDAPLFDERARVHNGDDRTMEACAKPSGSLGSGQNVGLPDNLAEGFDEGTVIRQARIAAISARSRSVQLNIRLHDYGSNQIPKHGTHVVSNSRIHQIGGDTHLASSIKRDEQSRAMEAET